jgi:NitT/TauT family transport system substrate-binding protein
MKRLVQILAFGSALMLSIQAQAQTPVETVRIQDFPGLGNLLGRVAVANKYCEAHGIKCELKAVPSAPLGLQMLLAGDLDLQMGPQEVLFNAVARGAKLKVVAIVHNTPMTFLVGSNKLATPNEGKGYPAIMQDLKGKKIGVTARGSGPEFQVISLLKGAGLSASDVTLVPVGAPDTALPALSSGQVDAVMSFEPMGGFCKVQKACRMLVDLRKGQGTPDLQVVRGATTLHVARADYAERKPQAIQAVRRALKDAENFVQDEKNRPAVLRILRDTWPLATPDADQVRAAVLEDSLSAMFSTLDAKALQAGADVMHRSGQLDKPIDTSTLLVGGK